MGVRQEVAMDSLEFHPCLICPTFLCPAGGPPTGQTAYGRLIPLWTPHAICLSRESKAGAQLTSFVTVAYLLATQRAAFVFVETFLSENVQHSTNITIRITKSCFYF
jgi:hypothetical protein